MTNEQKLKVMRGITKTAIATLTASRQGPQMSQEAKPQIQAATDNVAMQNSLSKGQRLLAPPPPPGSGKARKMLAGKMKAPKIQNTAKFGVGMPKMAKADTKRLLVEALMEKQANRFTGMYRAAKGGYKGLKNWWKGPTPKPQNLTGPLPPGSTPVSKAYGSSFVTGVKDSFRSKGAREALKSQRNLAKEQRLITDSLRRAPTTRDPKSLTGFRRSQETINAFRLAPTTPKLFGRQVMPSAKNLPKSYSAPKGVSGKTFSIPGMRSVRPGKTALRDYARSQRNLARNELAGKVGRGVGTLGREGLRLTGAGAGVGALYGAGKHLHTTGSMSNITGSTLAGAGEGALTTLNPSRLVSGGLGKSTQDAIETPLRGALGTKSPHMMTAAERNVNKIDSQAADLSSRYKGSVAEANKFLKATDSPHKYNDNWQKVPWGTATKTTGTGKFFSSGVEMSPEAVQFSKKMDGLRRSRAQKGLDAAVQNSGR